MIRAVVTGYASLDYAVSVDGDIRWGWTSRIASRPRNAWPRPGGCPFYVARPLAQAGQTAAVVTWTGDDETGRLYAECCRQHRIAVDGIAAAPDAATPVSVLLYQGDGRCACLVDFGTVSSEMTAAQERLIRAADLVCITVGPAACGVRALELARPDALIVWVAKNDPVSFSPDLRTQLGRRARYIFCNSEERAGIDAATVGADASQVVVETRGADPILVRYRQVTTSVAVEPLRVHDTTGAGDTLAGATLAALLSGESDPLAAVRAGAYAAHALLRERSSP
jgi:ribokinase